MSSVTKDFFIGIDAGSSVCKAALFDEDGRQVATRAVRTHVQRPHPGWSELDPEEAWNACRQVVGQLVRRSGVAPRSIAGIGLAAAMVGAWVVDAAGNALRPGIIWEDSRAQAIIERHLAATPDFHSRIFRSSGSVLQQGCTLPVLAWLAENEPEILARAAHVLSYKDFLRMKLTGLAATDRSEAAVGPGSARDAARSEEMIALFGLEKHSGLLPEVRDSETVHGTIGDGVAAELGLPAGVPVAVGAGDVPATVICSGALEPGRATGVLGTTCLLGVCHDSPVFEPADVGLLFTLPGGVWYRVMTNVAGTLSLDWAISALAPDIADDPRRYDRLTELARSVPTGANGLVFLPYLSESGIISPRVDPAARAQFAGLAPRHGRPELFRAVFEGTVFAMCDLAEALAMSTDTVLLTGGGNRNPFWMQMLADALGRSVVVPEGNELGARGAALLAATALGRFPDIRSASRAVLAEKTRYRPREEEAPALLDALSRYRQHRDRLLS